MFLPCVTYFLRIFLIPVLCGPGEMEGLGATASIACMAKVCCFSTTVAIAVFVVLPTPIFAYYSWWLVYEFSRFFPAPLTALLIPGIYQYYLFFSTFWSRCFSTDCSPFPPSLPPSLPLSSVGFVFFGPKRRLGLSWTTEAKLIVVVTKKGHLARLVAKFRPNVPVRPFFLFFFFSSLSFFLLKLAARTPLCALDVNTAKLNPV